jgi:hypothetical protein
MSNDSDDLIIDLTELMDEEDSAEKQTPEKSKSEERTLKLKTEAFDLGRELTIDDQPEKKPEDKFDFDKVFKESLDGIAAPKKPEPEQHSPKDEHEFPFEERLDEVLSEKPAIEKADIETHQESLKKDTPEMVESIARPIVSELVNEIVSSIKKDLPGIIEKVIREEIEKLKKIN